MYAVFKKSNSRMAKLSECMLFDYEYQAQWQCVIDPTLTYKEIKY